MKKKELLALINRLEERVEDLEDEVEEIRVRTNQSSFGLRPITRSVRPETEICDDE